MSENLSQQFRELQPNEIFERRYRIVKEVGRGGMGRNGDCLPGR